ncbi:VOC family protein [Roseobacter weihaiensis]|uniref:hypothetical protein n=1 Tax=Roseobacter weihaiensis TaxID=2763262 RepID=UPI001D0B2E61|nr:hypothetical protein [Roseobacter sp. H9]
MLQPEIQCRVRALDHIVLTVSNISQAGREFARRAAHPTTGTADLCFLTDASIKDRLKYPAIHQVDIETGLPHLGATGPLTSLYIRNPDQNLIEISVLQR